MTIIVILASLALWSYVVFLLATGSPPPAWLLWPLLMDLVLDFFAVPIHIHENRALLAAWRVLMVLVTVSAILWVVRAH